MIDILVRAYTPLILWTGLGALALRFLPQTVPRLLGRSLYWVGVPWQIFALARQTDFSTNFGLVPVITITTISTGLLIAWIVLQGVIWMQQHAKAKGWTGVETWTPTLDSATKGTFVIASTIGNTGFVGLGIIPTLLHNGDMSWAVFFSVTQNLIGTYGIGVLIASYYGHSGEPNSIGRLLKNLLTVPSLWAFAISYLTQTVAFPDWGETIVESSLLFVVPASFLLMGMRLIQLDGLQSLKAAAIPVMLKILMLPTLVGIGTTLIGLTGDARLSLVLMAGMPSAFAGLILAEEYNLDRELAASSIAFSTIGILAVIPIWLWLLR